MARETQLIFDHKRLQGQGCEHMVDQVTSCLAPLRAMAIAGTVHLKPYCRTLGTLIFILTCGFQCQIEFTEGILPSLGLVLQL
jgi:hypothetical protein